ncbi:Ephrin type-B receptor 3 [Holothuria leucospilota]|uniref:Ephrin type-B receptor 3 n=1 Tax=Holothuria leucospilota TaxID=206669 RepID=A0A9Q1HDM4_HOLLE|nr:Ephrin type-B receptor 3 [Holothuria leucospilota]
MEMLRTNFLCFVFQVGLWFPLFCVSTIIAMKHHIVLVSDNVLLESCGTSSTKKYWSFEGTVMYFNKMAMDQRFGNTVTVLQNFSLAITSASLEHEGTYECRHDKLSMMNHSLEVRVLPHVELSIDDKVKQDVYHLEAGNNISIVCNASGAKPAVNVTFMVNNNIISPLETEFDVSVNRQSNQTFDSVGQFKTQLWGTSGNVTCFTNGQDASEEQGVALHYYTYSVPVVAVTLNGEKDDDVIYVSENDTILAECSAREARPAVNITWRIDNREIDIKSETITIITSNTSETTETFNSYSSMRYQPSMVNGTISCVTTLENTGIVQEAVRSFYTYVIPEVFIVVNGKDSGEVVNIVQGEEIVASCHTTETRPDVGLDWMVNNAKLDHNIGLYNLELKRYEKNMTTYFISTLRFLPKETQGNITCSVKGHPAGDKHVHARYQKSEFKGTAIHTTHKAMRSIVIYLLVPTSVFLFSLACFFVRKALHVSGESNLSRSQECPPEDSCRADEYRPKGSQLQHTSSHIERKESLTSENEISETVQYQRPPKLELPELPEEFFDPGYTSVTENETGYCTVLREEATDSRIFYEKDLCLILSMKMGQLYNRWMGSINVSDGTSKCVVISTVSDTTLKDKSINWNGFIKRVLELPDNINLTKIEGICVDSAHLYLLHEHLICGTLEIRVKEKQDKDVSEIIGYISGILEGMELIHSYGFLHPGLSTKKILLTKEGVCKLYDFCLSENAASVVSNKKASMNCSVNQLAPEALLRNEYTQGSDVWSVAVVIWEIMTGGCPPFCLDGPTMSSQRISVAPETWPEMYQQLRNNRLIDCWNRDLFHRPTVNQLRNSFKGLFETLESQTLKEDFLQTTLDLYVPMKDSKEVDKG